MIESIPYELLFIVLLIAMVLLTSRFLEYWLEVSRTKSFKLVATKLGLTHPVYSDLLAQTVKELMGGADLAKPEHLVGLNVGLQNVVLGVYTHKRNDEHRKRPPPFVYYGAICIFVGNKDVPVFSLQRNGLLDGFSYEPSWAVVDLNNDEFASGMGLKVPSPQLEKAQAFFNGRPKLIDFCLNHRQYRLLSNGVWILFYRRKKVLEISVDNYAHQIALSEQLIECLDLSERAFADHDDYESGLKSLKSKHKNR